MDRTRGGASQVKSQPTSTVARDFLGKIQQKATAQQLPPGQVLCVVERASKSDPISAVGLTLTPDCEVVAAIGPSEKVPLRHMIFRVNSHFVQSSNDFEEYASKYNRLEILLDTTTGMSELIAKVQNDTEDEVPDLAPYASISRYGFLSIDHPLSMRWQKRLDEAIRAKRDLRAIMKQQEDMRRRDEEAKANQKLEEMLKAATSDPGITLPKTASAPFVPFIPQGGAVTPFMAQQPDHSEFSQETAETAALLEIVQGGVEPSGHDINELLNVVVGGGVPITLPPSTTQAELLILPPPPEPSVPPPPPVVQYFIKRAEEYVMDNGEKVTVGFKMRVGALPSPPPDDPPYREPSPEEVPESAAVPQAPDPEKPKGPHSDYVCRVCGQKGHWIDDCPVRQAPRQVTSKEVCKDYQRGHCSRTHCIFRHVAPEDEKPPRRRSRSEPKRGRSRERSRGKRDKSRERSRSRDRSKPRREKRPRSRGASRRRKRSASRRRDDRWSKDGRRL